MWIIIIIINLLKNINNEVVHNWLKTENELIVLVKQWITINMR